MTGDPCHRARQDKVRRRPVTKQKLGKSELCSDWLGWVPIDADRHGGAGVLSEAVGGYPDRVCSASRVYPKLSEVDQVQKWFKGRNGAIWCNLVQYSADWCNLGLRDLHQFAVRKRYRCKLVQISRHQMYDVHGWDSLTDGR